MVGMNKYQGDPEGLGKQLKELKDNIVSEFKELLGIAIKAMPMMVSPQAGGADRAGLSNLNDDPVFIPAKIMSNADQEITVNENEQSSTDLSNAAEALRRAKEKNKNG